MKNKPVELQCVGGPHDGRTFWLTWNAVSLHCPVKQTDLSLPPKSDIYIREGDKLIYTVRNVYNEKIKQ